MSQLLTQVTDTHQTCRNVIYLLIVICTSQDFKPQLILMIYCIFIGTMLGLCASVLSLVRTIGPTIGGFLYETFGVASFGYIQFVVSATTFTLLFMSSTRRNTAHYRWTLAVVKYVCKFPLHFKCIWCLLLLMLKLLVCLPCNCSSLGHRF